MCVYQLSMFFRTVPNTERSFQPQVTLRLFQEFQKISCKEIGLKIRLLISVLAAEVLSVTQLV